jgi:cyclohexanecarboxylate-CoA ligase
MTADDRLAQRRADHWRDKTILGHLDHAIERTPDKTAIVAIRSEGGQEKRLTYRRHAVPQ